MRCANVVDCEDVKSGKCNGIQIKLKYPCTRFKALEADSCDGCKYLPCNGATINCDHCCRNEMNKVDNYKFGGE
jgi:hypothetical protein